VLTGSLVMPYTLEAIRQGIREEMERDPTVFCLGEDFGIYGGTFKVTEGFIDRFGPERVIDAPIAELGGGTSSVRFDYRMMALRRKYENVRFADHTNDPDPRKMMERMRSGKQPVRPAPKSPIPLAPAGFANSRRPAQAPQP
jgi:hypothetical protein